MSEHQATRTITVGGPQFQVPLRYHAGYTIQDEAEADSVNQGFVDLVRGRLAKLVKKAQKDGGEVDQQGLQAQLDEMISNWSFTAREEAPRTRSRDPVMKKALENAKEHVIKGLIKNGESPKSYSAKQLSDAARERVAQRPDYLTVARQQIELAAALAE